MQTALGNSRMERYFRGVVNRPWPVVCLALLLMVVCGLSIPSLQKDTRADAFLASDNPALIYRDKVKTLFGLSDPLVIAVVAEQTIFSAENLNALSLLTDVVLDVDNVDPERVVSLATENNITGTEDGMEVEPFYESPLDNEAAALLVRDAIRDFPLYQGSLVANDETATLIVAELIDEALAEETYQALMAAIASANLPDSLVIHVAGEGAISGFLGSYIDADAQRLNPIAAVIITIIMMLAFLRIAATLMGGVIIGAAAVITLGVMAAAGVPFYVITNALPVILIGIAVADSIHIYNEYFTRRAQHPDEPVADAVVATMMAMWRPVTLTTLTTMAGFLGLYFAAYMPPFKFFGLFAALGVGVAWLYSLTFLPAAMSLLKTPVHPRFASHVQRNSHDFFARIMVSIGRFTERYPRRIIAVAVVAGLMGGIAASQLIINEDRIRTFHQSEPLFIADQAINQRFNGTNYLDVVIDAQEVEGLFDPAVLTKMQALQQYALTLDGVQSATSIVDYLQQMNRALNNGDADAYRLPGDRELVAQYFLIYSASSSPSDFEEEVDYDYRWANMRITLNDGAYTTTKGVVESLEHYIQQNFNADGLTATLSGRVNLNYHWIKDLGVSHFAGMAIALLLVWLVSSLLFRSAIAGLYALAPVATSILVVYATMVVFAIPLGVGTSMFAAVAIGLGVDFAIHTLDRLQSLYKESGDMKQVLANFYPTTGRALLLNLLAIALGFGVLVSSQVVPLTNFGMIVSFSVVTSFLVSIVLLPALVLCTKPQFITRHQPDGLTDDTAQSFNAKTLVPVVALIGLLGLTPFTEATPLPEGRWVIDQVNAVDEGEHVTRKLAMRMIDRRGKVRARDVISYRKYYGEEKRTVLFYLSPKNVKDTGFLTYDYPEAERDDDQWLYLPALRKSRRISASDRGDYFLGTDFTYEDIKQEGKVETSDYTFTTLKREGDLLVVEAIPVNVKIAKELGYGRVHSWINPTNWQIEKAVYWDTKMNPLKRLAVSDIRKVDGIWTRHQLTVDNEKTGHRTELVFSNVDYQTPVKDPLFTRRALSRGANQ